VKRKVARCAPTHARIIVSNWQAQVYEGPIRIENGCRR
jgi:hypothetical protein